MKLKGRDWLGAAATLFALAVTFNAEYEIAIAVHINPIVAYAVPGALDVYVLRALQVKRDVFLTVLAMVAVNAASHLVTAGVLRVSPALIVGVSAIAPLVLWRAHVLRHEASTKPERWWRRSTVPPVPEHVPAFTDVCPTCFTEHGLVCPAQPIVPGFEEHAAQAVDVASTGAVNAPEHDDMEKISRAWEGKHAVPDPEHSWDGTVVDLQGNTEHAFPTSSTIEYPSGYVGDIEARVLSLVPPLPAGFEHVLGHEASTYNGDTDMRARVLANGDKEFLDRARELSTPTIRALKELGMGNDRARRIKQYLETENTEARS